MRIMSAPIVNNYPSNMYQTRTSSPNFKGVLNERETERVLKMLAEKNREVILNVNTVKNFQKILNDFFLQYRRLGISSVGIQIIPEDRLSAFIGKNQNVDLKDKIGLCIAVGDKYGPIESWNKVFDAKTILAQKSLLLNKTI